ncbi:MAG: choice-of-anchor D domain-containing protein, partial [Candidatus Saccharicenans sp.]
SLNLGKIKAPLISTVTKVVAGDCSGKEIYEYDATSIKYGLPRRIKYYGNDDLRYYKQFTYYFEGNSIFANKYMLSYIANEKTYSSGGTLQKETNIGYYDSAGKCGAIDWIKRKISSSSELTWDYTYDENTTSKTITITVNPPGSTSGIQTYVYKYGVLAKKQMPGFLEFDRTISPYDSSIMSETNQHGATYYFSYDNLGRIIKVDLPSGFNYISASWATNSVTISQGQHIVTKFWDGLGRDLGYTEQGDGLTLYYRKILDAEGRVVKENKGTTNSTEQFVYSYNAAGRITQIKDPLNKITSYSYSGNTTIITDPVGNKTELTFSYFPGLISTLKDPSGASATYTYDALGRLTSTVYNSGPTQSYSYDFLDNITSESHPETGTITYTYNAENLLAQKSNGGISINYEYNSSNQLTKITASDETINYVYDSKGRINRVYSSKGWERNNITYNPFGAVTQEVHLIPGLGSKTVQYAYDANNILKKIIYPDSKYVEYVNNGLNLPETVSFNGQSLISQVTYGINKRPTSISISGNGTQYNATYNSIGRLVSASLTKSGIFLYKASYSYDGVGNVIAINDAEPNLNVSFTYDRLYRLLSASYDPAGIGRVNNFEYGYDQYGNITLVKENGSSVFIKSYNSKNQRTDLSYDSRGNLTSANGYQYLWDSFNRLMQINYGGELKGKYLYNERGLRIRALPALPEINLKVGSTNIVSGSYVEFRTSPGTYIDKTFTIENVGDAILNLSGSPIIVINGPDANQFSVIQQPTASLAPGATTSFIIRFSPCSSGTKSAVISIANDDLDENPYLINLTGTNPIPDINLKLDSVDVGSGQSVDISCSLNSTVDKTFLIENKGDGQLYLTANPPISIFGPEANQFAVTQQPATSIEPGGNTSFIIRFAPTSSGNKSATINIANNDPDENPYQININGIVITAGPEIDIPQVPNGGTYDFGTVKAPKSVTFTITNLGDAPLLLTGNPPVDLQGENFDEFSVTQPASTTIQPGGSTTFRVTISPVTSDPKSAFITIFNNDSDENPYEIELIAYAQVGAQPVSIVVTDPDGQEDVEANSATSITWAGGSNIQNLKIEYSLDNGSSYHTLTNKCENKGLFKWQVPDVFTPGGLVRITDVNGLPFEPEMISYEFYFKIIKKETKNGGFMPFKVNFKIPEQKTHGSWQSEISILPGKLGQIEQVRCNLVENQFNSTWEAINRWHHLKAIFDRKTYSISAWIDGVQVIENASMEFLQAITASANLEITLMSSPGAEILVDDLMVKVWNPVFNLMGDGSGRPVFIPLLKERFENYSSDEELALGGWKISRIGEDNLEGELLNVLESASGLKSLRLSSGDGGYYVVSKSIALPERYPFDVSDESFAIRAKKRTVREKEEEIKGVIAR